MSPTILKIRAKVKRKYKQKKMAYITFSRLKMYFRQKISTAILYPLNKYIEDEIISILEPLFSTCNLSITAQNMLRPDLEHCIHEYLLTQPQYHDTTTLTLKMRHTRELIRKLRMKYKYVIIELNKENIRLLHRVILYKLERVLIAINRIAMHQRRKLITITILNIVGRELSIDSLKAIWIMKDNLRSISIEETISEEENISIQSTNITQETLVPKKTEAPIQQEKETRIPEKIEAPMEKETLISEVPIQKEKTEHDAPIQKEKTKQRKEKNKQEKKKNEQRKKKTDQSISCILCDPNIRQGTNMLRCDMCKIWFHRTCLIRHQYITQYLWTRLCKDISVEYICKKCMDIKLLED